MKLFAQRVVLGDGVEVSLRIAPAELSIHEGCIENVDERDTASGPDVVDLGEKVLCPAFVNAHTHAALGAFRGLATGDALRGNMVESLFFRLEERLTDQDVRAFARLGAYECLLSGTGLVWDHYYGGLALAEAFVDVGLAAVVAPTVQDVSGPGASRSEEQLSITESLDDESWYRRGIWSALGPHATDTVSPELWRRIGMLAEKHQWVVHAHVAQSIDEVRRTFDRHGCSPMALLERTDVLARSNALLVHALFVSDDDLRRLDPSRHTLGFCPLSQSQFGFPAHIQSWVERRLPWFVATDCSASNDAMNLQRELPLVVAARGYSTTHSEAHGALRSGGSLRHAEDVERDRTFRHNSMPAFADSDFLLSRVWSVPGRLHPRFRAGEIAVGALANLLVLDPAHPSFWPGNDVLRTLALADTAAAIEKRMILGRWIPEGDALRDRYEEHHREATQRLTAHLRDL